jgi:hypothetical protein
MGFASGPVLAAITIAVDGRERRRKSQLGGMHHSDWVRCRGVVQDNPECVGEFGQ